MDDAAGDRLGLGLAGIARDLDVAEAVEGEARLVDLLALALEDVAVGRPGGAQVRGVDGAVRVQGLGVAQGDFGPSLPLDLEANPADHVLAHVEDVDAVSRAR